MSLPIDFTITQIIDLIYIKLDKKISKEVILAVIDFQSYTIRKGIEDGEDIHIKYLGSFKFNHKRAYKLQESGKEGSMKTVQEITKPSDSKSFKIKEITRIIFKKAI
jgi:nucleoid DNA-binding protein